MKMTRLASQIMSDLTRRHENDLTADEAVVEMDRVTSALKELNELPVDRAARSSGLMSALPILAVAFGRRAGVNVRIGGSTACTDGKSITLPSLPMEAPQTLRTLALGYLYHETGHIETTQMKVFKQAASESPLLRNLLNVLEDVRMEAWRNAKYPGSAAVLADLTGVLQADGSFGNAEGIETADEARTLCMSLITGLRSSELDQPLQAIAALWRKRLVELVGEAVVRKLDVITTGTAQLNATSNVLQLARRVISVLEEAKEEPEKQPSEPEQSESSDDTQEQSKGDSEQDEDSDGEGTDDTSAKDDSSKGDAEGDGDSDEGSGGESDADAGESGDSSSAGKANGTASGDPEDGQPTAAQRQAISKALEASDEDIGETDLGDILKDELEQAAEKACQAEAQAGGGSGGSKTPHSVSVAPMSAQNELAEVAAASQKLRTRMASKLQANARVKRTHVEKGTRLDGMVLHRLFVNDPRVFLRKERKATINTAVQIVLDRSSSMSGKDMEVARKAALAAALGLGQIPRVKTAACAFPDLLIMKQFDERAQKVAGRFTLHASGGTPMAEAMLWSAANLAPRREERKLMIVVTDGQPNDPRAVLALVKKMSNAGIECVGVGINCDVVKNLFPQWVVIRDVEELASTLFQTLGQQLTGRRIAA